MIYYKSHLLFSTRSLQLKEIIKFNFQFSTTPNIIHFSKIGLDEDSIVIGVSPT